MPETTPPVPKSGGSGPFILAAIVMLLLMGGLIYWKTKGSDTETAKVEAPKPSATVEQPALDEPPPPPPPPVASTDSSASPTASATTTKKVGSTGGGACGPCSGDTTSSIVSQLHAKGAQARSCYEHALRQNAMLAGRMSINVTISATGSVCSASVGSNELGDPGVANCVVQMMKSGTFSAPTNGCVQVAVPLNFTPKT
jgi:outer membrane biosynthesis protein TonB